MNVVRTFNYNDGLETAARLLDKRGAWAICKIVEITKKYDNPALPFDEREYKNFQDMVWEYSCIKDHAYEMAAEIRKEFRDDIPPPFKVT